MRRNVLAAILVVLCIVVVSIAYLKIVSPPGAPARVITADDRTYFAVIHNLLSQAEHSIDAILYQSRFYFQYPLSTSNTLIGDLAGAADRGVRVRAVIEQADWNIENSEENRDVRDLLSGAGVEVYYDPIATTSHSKIVILDGRYVAVGSANWSYYSLDRNHEASVVIESDEIADMFKRYFEGLLERSTPTYTSSGDYINASEVKEWEGRYALIKDLPDSGVLDTGRGRGRIYMGGLVITVEDRALEKTLAVDSLFFAEVGGETLRVVARTDRERPMTVLALDLELPNTKEAMAKAFGIEKAKMIGMSFPKPSFRWIEALRVVPIPNERYVTEIRKLIGGAKKRIWVAMLDARYYESTPRSAKKTERRGDIPSLTNVLLSDLEKAARRGLDVRFLCDMGWSGRPPEGKLAFLERLVKAGASVYEDPPDVTTHAKLAIVDDDFTVIGSTNWTYHAVEENNETAVVIESAEINDHYARYIESIIGEGKAFEGAD